MTNRTVRHRLQDAYPIPALDIKALFDPDRCEEVHGGAPIRTSSIFSTKRGGVQLLKIWDHPRVFFDHLLLWSSSRFREYPRSNGIYRSERSTRVPCAAQESSGPSLVRINSPVEGRFEISSAEFQASSKILRPSRRSHRALLLIP